MYTSFDCENCGTFLRAEFFDDEMQDKVECSCGTTYTVIRPIKTIEEDETETK